MAAERTSRRLCQYRDRIGSVLSFRRTTQAQRPGPQGRALATWTRWPGSLQRLVRPTTLSIGTRWSESTDTRLPPAAQCAQQYLELSERLLLTKRHHEPTTNRP